VQKLQHVNTRDQTQGDQAEGAQHKTNNQFSVGMSILQSSMDMEAE
jgi:hypothetical protein